MKIDEKIPITIDDLNNAYNAGIMHGRKQIVNALTDCKLFDAIAKLALTNYHPPSNHVIIKPERVG